MGLAAGSYESSKGGISESSVLRGANPRGGNGHLLGTRVSSSGDILPSSLDVGGGLGAGALVVSSL